MAVKGNPFKFGGVVRGIYFADSVKELEELYKEVEATGRVFLLSPRRFGKTSFVANLMDKLRGREVPVPFVDLNACPDLDSFATSLIQRLSNALETELDKLFKILSGIKRLMPKLFAGPNGQILRRARNHSGAQRWPSGPYGRGCHKPRPLQSVRRQRPS